MRAHQATDKGSDKPALHGNNIIRHKPDSSTHLSRNTDGQLGVLVAFVVVATLVDKVVVDVCGLHAGENIEQEDGVGEGGVLEGADLGALAALACHVVGPLDHVGVGDFALTQALGEAVEGGDNVLAHQLPDETESKGALAVSDVGTLDTRQRELNLLAELDGVVGVLEGLEAHQLLAFAWLVHVSPVYAARNDLVVCLQNDCAVLEVLVERLYNRFDVKRVEPQSKDTSLTLSCSVKVVNLGLLLLGDGVEAGVCVEQVGDES